MKTITPKFFFILSLLFVISYSAYANKRLCLIGDATRSGWSSGDASPMIQDATNPTVFHYDAWLNAGYFKFILENNDGSYLPTWNKIDDTHIVKRTSNSDPDDQFNITTEGNYSVTVDTLNLTISITPMDETEKIEFNTVFMVGNATPNGWDVANSTELIKSTTNPFEFTYTGALTVGEFKFPVNRNSGWGQDFFMRVSDTEMILQNSPDAKWSITAPGNYIITMNTRDLSISIQQQTTTGNPLVTTKNIILKSAIVNSELNVKNLNSFKYNIYNVCGKSMIAGNTTNGTIDVSNLQKGIYLLKANSQVFKFIKK